MYACCELLLQCLGGLVVAYYAYSLASKLWYFITTYCFKTTLDASKYGKWTVITGASDGIGKQFAMKLAERGQNVVLISRSLQKLQTVAKEIESKYGVWTKCVEADFKGGQEIYERIADVVAGLDVGVLVNNVGIGRFPNKFADSPDVEEYIDELVAVNLMSLLKMSKMVIPGMDQRKRGLIINVSSGTAVRAHRNLALYGASKAFMDYFSCATALEYKEDGIDIVSLMPYLVSTNAVGNLPLSFWVRSTDDSVCNAMSAIASGSKRTYGCWQHDLQGWIGRNLPNSVYQNMIPYILAQAAKKE